MVIESMAETWLVLEEVIEWAAPTCINYANSIHSAVGFGGAWRLEGPSREWIQCFM